MPEENVQSQASEGEGEGEGEGEPIGEEQNEQVQTLQERLADVNNKLKQTQSESRGHQRRADRNEQMITRLRTVQPVTPSKGPARVQPAQEQTVQPTGEEQETLEEFANETAKEAALLRELLSRGLTLEDGDDIEFESVGELRLQLDVIQQRREIESLKEQITHKQEAVVPPEGEPAPASDVQIDTGGRTGSEGADQIQTATDLRKQATDLKAQGRYTEAQWVAIRAAQEDPSKIIPVRPGESR